MNLKSAVNRGRPILVLSLWACLLVFPNICMAALPDNLTVDVGDIDGDGQSETLVLQKRSVRSSSHYQVLTWDTIDGYQSHPTPEVRTYRGYVQDDPDMRVNANIEPGDATINANLSDGRNINIRLTQQAVTISGPAGTVDPGTGNVEIPLTVDRTSPTPRGYVIPRHTMRRIHVAADIWNDYYIGMASDVDACVARMEQRFNDTDFFYARDMGIAWELTTVVVRVEELTTSWKSQWTGILKPGGAVYNACVKYKKPGGGGASGEIFDAADPDHSVYCTVGTIAAYSRSLGHEVGHQFKAGHQSSWDDIMSGAASCLGYGTVERLIDHSHIALEAAAPAITYGAPVAPYAMEDGANTQENQSVDIDLLENDYDGNGDAISLAYVDSTTAKNGSVQIILGGVVRYTPPEYWLGQDEFVYHVADSTGLTNRTGYVKVYVRNNDIATHILFDETEGETAKDVGPYQAHGVLTNGLSSGNSVTGKYGYAARLSDPNDTKASADFDGTGDPMDGSLSVSLWVKYPQASVADGVLICKGGAVIPNKFDKPRGGWTIGHLGEGGFSFIGNLQRNLYQDPETFDRTSSGAILADTWYHLVMVIDRPSRIVRAWVNDQQITNSVNGSFVADGMISASHHPMVVFDTQSQQDQGNWDGPAIIDDVRIYNKPLTGADVAGLYAANDEIPAGAPSPANGATDVVPGVELSWTAGKPTGYEFEVYFGSDYDEVFAADPNSPQYMGKQAGTTYQSSSEIDRQYYWRIDEVTASTTVGGRVWGLHTGSDALFDPPLANPSFESPVVQPAETESDIEAWNDSGAYTNTAWAGFDPAEYPPTTYGDNWADLGNSKYIYQQVGVYTPEATYDITFMIGRRVSKTFRGAIVSLWAGGNPAMADDSMDMAAVGAAKIADSGLMLPAIGAPGSSEEAVSLSTGTGYAVGEPLWLQIEQGGGNGRTLIDNVAIKYANNPPDINDDGNINYGDFATISAHFMAGCAGPLWCAGADLNISGSVDPNDVIIVGERWLTEVSP